jgi:hypothetical protein
VFTYAADTLNPCIPTSGCAKTKSADRISFTGTAITKKQISLATTDQQTAGRRRLLKLRLTAPRCKQTQIMKHNGQKCPVTAGTLVDLKFRDGTIKRRVPALCYTSELFRKIPYEATIAHWDDDDMPNDIVEYQLSKPE